jgi:hypothetical protein
MTRWKMFGSNALVAAVLGLTPNLALADRGDHYDRGDRYREHDQGGDRTDVRVDVNLGGRDRAPAYEERTTRVWVEPEYRTVCDNVWVEPVYRDECDRVWMPDRYERRDVLFWDRGRRIVRQDRVLVEPGHYEDVHRQVVVSPGHWENVERREYVSPGHWEYRTERFAVDDRRWDRGGFDFDIFTRLGR